MVGYQFQYKKRNPGITGVSENMKKDSYSMITEPVLMRLPFTSPSSTR